MEEIIENKKRIDTIDILRALGILIMVAGHLYMFGGKFDRYIHSFHMPLFFIISGYLYKVKNGVPLYKMIIGKGKRLLIPYVFYAVVSYSFWVFMIKDDHWYVPLINLISYNTQGLPICGALWFLTALFWAEIIYMIIDSLINVEWVRAIIVFVISISGAFIQQYTLFRLPLSLDSALVCMFFLEFGRFVKMHGKKVLEWVREQDIRKLIVLSCLILGTNLVLSFVNPYVNVKSGWYGFIPLFFLNACLGTSGYYIIALLLDRELRNENLLKDKLVFIGRVSLIYMGFNQLLIFVLDKLCGKWKAYIPGIVYAVLLLIVVLVMLYILSRVVNVIKNKYVRLIFGI